MDPLAPPADPPLAPAEMCEMVGRLIFRGLPVPVTISLRGPKVPQVLVMPDGIEEWVEQTAATDGAWTLERGVEHYRAHAGGFDIVSNRPHIHELVTT